MDVEIELLANFFDGQEEINIFLKGFFGDTFFLEIALERFIRTAE